jgi:hypothetical protein
VTVTVLAAVDEGAGEPMLGVEAEVGEAVAVSTGADGLDTPVSLQAVSNASTGVRIAREIRAATFRMRSVTAWRDRWFARAGADARPFS